MIKWLIVGLGVYLVYRFYIAPPGIEGNKDAEDRPQIREEKSQNDQDEDFIDYEEVE